MPKFKLQIEGKEVEVDLTPDQIKAAGFLSQTELLESEDLFEEAAEMRGFKGKKTSNEINSLSKKFNDLMKVVEAQKEIIERIATEKNNAEGEVKKYLADQRKKEIDSLIDKALKDGRIVPDKKDAWIKRLTDNYDSTVEVINELPPNPALNNGSNGSNGNNGNNMAGGGSSTGKTGNKILDSIREHNASAVITEN